MTALTGSAKRDERYPGRSFGYQVAAGQHVYAGGLVGVDASGQLHPAGTANVVAIVGICQREVDNTSGAITDLVQVSRGTWAIAVTAATPANIGGPVYATDDNTCQTTNAGGQLPVGTLAAIEGATTWVRI